MKQAMRQNGFTLLELLTALTLLGMILALLFQGIRMGGQAWEKGEGGLSEWRRGEVVLDLISRQLGAVLLPEGGLYVQTPVFFGEDKEIVFLSNYPLHGDSEARLVRVGYAVVEGNEGRPSLRYCETAPHLPAPITSGLPPLREWSVLYEGFSELDFEYLASQPEVGSEFRWVPIWTPSARRKGPAAVRIRCRWSGESVSLVVPLRGALGT